MTCGQRDGDIELNLETDTGRARIVTRTLVEKCWIARSQANGRGAPGAAVPCGLQRSRSGESWCRRLDLKAVSVALGMIFQRCNWARALRKADTHGEAAVGHGVGGNGGAVCGRDGSDDGRVRVRALLQVALDDPDSATAAWRPQCSEPRTAPCVQGSCRSVPGRQGGGALPSGPAEPGRLSRALSVNWSRPRIPGARR